MTRRHQRHRNMWNHEIALFDAEATEFHRHLQHHLHRLRPTGPHYKIIQGLADHTRQAIEAITGEEPSWVRGTKAVVSFNSLE